MMELRSSSVHRNLEAKWKIGPLEGPDLLILLIIASSMNFIFGNSTFGFYMTFVFPGFLSILLYFGKRNKPDKYLVHLLKDLTSNGHFVAGDEHSKRNLATNHIVKKEAHGD